MTGEETPDKTEAVFGTEGGPWFLGWISSPGGPAGARIPGEHVEAGSCG
ncbi:hypothetical protein [Amycolatopsis sp. cmx-11-51]